VWASGLTNVTSLAFDSRGSLYAVQLAKDGLLNAPPDAPPVGSVVKVSRTGAHRVVADNLLAPYGIAISGHKAYVSTCSVCPGGGEVWRIAL
jgi:glucose/arabinose dehydrogenase